MPHDSGLLCMADMRKQQHSERPGVDARYSSGPDGQTPQDGVADGGTKWHVASRSFKLQAQRLCAAPPQPLKRRVCIRMYTLIEARSQDARW